MNKKIGSDDCKCQGMLNGSVQSKPDEQYPLLMVAGAGDATVRDPPPPVIDSLLWTTSVATKRPWADRWPEYLSTCWMTLILLGISFMVFYAVGMVVIYRHEAYILVKCNETKPANDVYYHDVIPRGGEFPLSFYANYLANVATLYPHLRFYVYFFIDDSKSTYKNSFLNKIYPFNSYEEYNVCNKREVKIFQKKYPNVNITVMPLSKYMALTPLKYRWRNIPAPYIPFYARIFAVWLNGGLGLDLAAHNEQYHMENPQRFDRKARALLKQHNDGIMPKKYMDTLNRLEREDESELFSSFICIIQKMFNDTLSMFNKSFTSISPLDSSSENPIEPATPQQSESKPLVRTHRSKREVVVTKRENKTVPFNETSQPAVVNIVLANTTVVDVTGDANKKNIYEIAANHSNANVETTSKQSNPEQVLDDSGWHSESASDDNGWHFRKMSNENSQNALPELFKSPEISHETDKNKSEGPQVVLFYDFSLISEPIRSDVSLTSLNSNTEPLKIVTIGAEGSFVASTWRMHPFLSSILSAGCMRMPPKFAIQNALLTRCSGPFKDENFCNGIYVL